MPSPGTFVCTQLPISVFAVEYVDKHMSEDPGGPTQILEVLTVYVPKNAAILLLQQWYPILP